MSRSSTTYLVGIGPSGSSQLTIPLSTPTNNFLTSTSAILSTTTTTSTSTSMSSTSSHLVTPTATSGASSGPSRSALIGAIVGGTLGGILALLWFAALMYWAHRHNCFRRPGYQRAREERVMFEKRDRPVSGVSQVSGGFGGQPPGPQGGLGARTFGEPPRSTFNDPPRSTYDDPPKRAPPPPKPIPIFGESRNDPEPPRNNFNDPPRNDPPRTTFSEPQRGGYNDPPRSMFNDAPSSNYGNRPISGFGDNGRDRGRPRSNFGMDRPRSAFGDRPISAYGDGGGGRRSVSVDRTRRGFFGGNQLNSDGTGGEWEGAGARRVEGGYGTPEMEEKTGWFGWLARARDNAARRKRIKSEYEEDMRQMRGRSVMGSEYRGY